MRNKKKILLSIDLNSYGLGFIGNLLSLIIFCSLDDFRKISTGSFFLFTTISNTFHLWTLSTEFLGVFDVYIYSNTFLQCGFNYFLQNVSRAISTYLAIGIAFDRLIRSELPIRSRVICTRRNAVIYTLFFSLIFSVLWSPFFSPIITRDPRTGSCVFNQSSSLYSYLVQVQQPLRLVLVCILPVLLMLLSNIRMLYNMRQSHRRVQNGHVALSSVTSQPNTHRISDIDRMLFYMMSANVGTFILTQIPFHVYSTVRSYYQGFDQFTSSLVRALLLIWSSIYFGVAFYLYCLASPLFRKKFLIISKRILRFIRCRRI